MVKLAVMKSVILILQLSRDISVLDVFKCQTVLRRVVMVSKNLEKPAIWADEMVLILLFLQVLIKVKDVLLTVM